MASYRTTRIIQIAFILLVIAIAIGGLIYLGRAILSNGTSSIPDTSQTALLSTTADRAVRLSVRGPIVADEDFRSYQIQITPNQRALTEYKGYLNRQFDNITLDNNIPAYEQLVYALDKANMMKGTELTGANNDVRGICADGNLYEFSILNAGKTLKMLWTTSCSNPSGSLSANLDDLTVLLTNQIPGAQSKIDALWQ